MIFDIPILKQVIRYPNDATLEATWVKYEKLPSDENLEQQKSTLDGKELSINSNEDGEKFTEILVKCHAYHATQMDELREDLGESAEQYEALIQQCIADYVPLPPPDPSEIASRTIKALEIAAHVASQRLYREAVLSMFLDKAKSVGMTEEQLMAKNKGYKELKTFDLQIAALRSQL